ncbi:MAG: hypothetical protein A3G32_08145 [Deltaproteobacteria bacterium RIFCSPLOWO2_12_FULL_40_28]|nr:MAG: hypothetical protein A3C45_00845 [Deltaproteobacteria bacterium RIFCSPHIGHO2_02_FULL_40_28]OGQ20880.1 MAG: hypothetical protein A3E27_03510 [Deltaproteobacteria bacterium RIFCSPHIGHO2_12_FULL_40_32]OGQ39281.1 MAG: hypothetical protein A3I69_04870 [Deltaproteobacteria bacterium RIFCSPLOWO2_02_FULL_40_36]OGQ54562.1 MAG: hypothetical protein A3G32_08145 [Deltaproteobacteria bacterium RIFCSPLOWO2_12_FULL_40_28]
MTSSLKIIFKLVCTIALIVLIIFWIKWDNVWFSIKQSNALIIIFPTMVWIVSLLLGALRWFFLLREKEHPISYKKIAVLYWQSLFFINYLPAGLGGDVFRFKKLRDLKLHSKTNINILIIDRASGFFGILLLILLLGFSVKDLIRAHTDLQAIYLLSAVGMGLMMLACILKPKFLKHILNFKTEILLKIILISTFFQFLSSLSLYSIFHFLHIGLPFYQGLWLATSTTLSELIPITINSIGVKELSGVYLFDYLNSSKEEIISVFIVARSLQLILSLSGGMLYLFFNFKKAR